jgi:hypothetical protein
MILFQDVIEILQGAVLAIVGQIRLRIGARQWRVDKRRACPILMTRCG